MTGHTQFPRVFRFAWILIACGAAGYAFGPFVLLWFLRLCGLWVSGNFGVLLMLMPAVVILIGIDLLRRLRKTA